MPRSGEPDLQTLYRLISAEKKIIAAMDRNIARIDGEHVTESSQRKDNEILAQHGGYLEPLSRDQLLHDRRFWLMSLNRHRDRMGRLHDAKRLKAERRLTPCNIIRRIRK